jgi:hypothetical protein
MHVHAMLSLLLFLLAPSARASRALLAVPSDHWYRSQCGSWQAEYEQLHSEIVRGAAPYRAVVFSCPCGLSDALAGAMSTFYFALLSRRAILFGREVWTHGYKTRGVNWALRPQHGLLNKTTSSATMYLSPEEFRTRNLTSYREETDILHTLTLTGNIFTLFDNPYHRKRLLQMGLRPETAFGCAMSFLLQPVDFAFAALAPLWQVMLNPSHLVIGIQIRTGDDHMQNPDSAVDMSRYEAFVDCAKQVEGNFSRPGQSVFWLIVSDSIQLRRLLKQSYPDKVLLPRFLHLAQRPDHIMSGRGGPTAGSSKVVALAAMEQWLLGYSDFMVLSNTGYGRVAYFRTLGAARAFVVKGGTMFRNCGIGDADSMYDMVKVPPGI